MARNSFYDKDKGWNRLMTRLESASGESGVFVGFLRSSGQYKPKGARAKGEPSLTVAQVAAINEFGSSDGRVPERSFMRSAIDANADKITRLAKKLTGKVVDGTVSKKSALGILGQSVADSIRARIQKGVPPPNAPSTVARKKSSHTLIDTGQMVGAVEYEVYDGKRKAAE